METEHVLIAGCGDIGSRLGQQLAVKGDCVWGLRRRPEAVPAPIRPFGADLNRPESLDGLPEPIDLLYYIATPGEFSSEAYRAAYVDGLANLLRALENRRPRRLVFVSSTSVYGQNDGSWVTEDSPAQPRGFNGQRMLEAEELALSCGIPAVVVRFAGIYGPGRNRLLEKVRSGQPCTAEPPVYTNRIHRDDCVGVLAHLGRPEVPEGLYLAADDHPATQCEVQDWLAAALGLPRPPRQTAEESRRRAGSKRCDNGKLKRSGYRLLYPDFREGYKAMLG